MHWEEEFGFGEVGSPVHFSFVFVQHIYEQVYYYEEEHVAIPSSHKSCIFRSLDADS